jgi:hypothetical protein
MKQFREAMYPGVQNTKTVMPAPETIYEKKSLFKLYANLCKSSGNVRKVKKLSKNEQAYI